MACSKRERTGFCTHSQCPFPEQSGYECIEIIDNFCEIGEGCVVECEHSYTQAESEKAIAAFKAAYPIEEEEAL